MEKFSKTLLQSYVLTNCKRRLFLELGRFKPNLWFDPVRDIPSKKPERLAFQTKYLTDKGDEYQHDVYTYLKKVEYTYFKENINGEIENSDFIKENLSKFYNKLLNDPDKTLMLLEYQFKIPDSFFNKIFFPKPGVKEIPVDFSRQRPDIVFIGNKINNYLSEVFEILDNGNIRKVPEAELKERFGISIFDIKYVQDENVGKKHFLEIFYYLKTLVVFIKENDLQEKFYIRANFNGIFPLHDTKDLNQIQSINDIFDLKLANLISWKESDRIFNRVMNIIKKLWKNSPCPIESIKTNIHQGCGYCQYIEDCKITLGMDDGIAPKDWSLKLLPFTSQSIAQQLIKEYNFKTIGDVYDNIDTIQVRSIPKPLYSELPTLKLKSEALINNDLAYPKAGQTHSYFIPRYSPIALNFGVEYDRNNDRIFSVGIFLKMFISSKLNYHAVFNNWWRIWKKSMKKNKSNIEIRDELKDYLFRELPVEIVERFKYILEKLRVIQINLRGEKSSAGTEVIYQFASVNEDITPITEAKLTINTIHRLNLVLEMCNIIEEYIVTDGFRPGLYFGPDTSIFYWSPNQLENIQNMMQRNLDYIINDDKAREAYESILMYFTPSDTEVSHPFQHKKLFDIQGFAESFVGFPDIINYTWHGIAEKMFPNFKFSPKFWIPHFNFLDLTNWLRYLSEDDLDKKEKLKKQIKSQVILKLQAIDSIRYKFQKEGHFAMSKNARVISKSYYNYAILNSDYHDIAHVWHLFSRLNSALQQQNDEHYRTMFPEFSIGKLFAARAQNIQIHAIDEKNIYYSFDTVNLSSNMKIKDGNRVLLIPNYKRGLKLDKRVFKWIVFIDKISWIPSINGNHITTKATRTDVFEECKADGIDPKKQKWYIYPLSSDVWSNKLHNDRNDGLLERDNFGKSWLGFRLAFLWKIRSDPKLNFPEYWRFTTPSIYLFAPELLSKFNLPLTDDGLLTIISPKPDLSQEQAIKNSLCHLLSTILGPPGTGKSQTIAALIDEYVLQNQKRNKPAKILVSSFSYAALRVVVEKIRTGKDNNGNSTPSSQLQMVFLRSETQDPIQPLIGCRDVDDLTRKQKIWKLNQQKRSVTKNKLLEESLEDSFIMFANAHQLYNLKERVQDNFAFDLICIDEASQLPTDYFMSCLQYIHKPKLKIKIPNHIDATPGKNVTDKRFIKLLEIDGDSIPKNLTKVVIVGDHNQLPPVRVKNPPQNLELILDSLFRYYVGGHKISSKQLKTNYRSHKDIVEFTSLLGLYDNLQAHEKNATGLLKGIINNVKQSWIKEVLDPKKVVCSLIHNCKYEIGISLFEAGIVSKIVVSFYDMVEPKNEREEIEFWTKKIGVVAPHNAQGRTIIRMIFDNFSSKTHLSKPKLMEFLKNTVYSVEKFQGSDRDLIIASIGLSDEDKINAEDEFIFDLNRFNVLTSRAKNKVVFVASSKFLNFIPEDRKILESASKIYTYVEEFCNEEIKLEIKNENNEKKEVRFRYKK